jgi:hypothetical protein
MVQLACKCGAIYEVTTCYAPYGHTGVAICEVCRIVMDKWDGTTIYETYTRRKKKEDDSLEKPTE